MEWKSKLGNVYPKAEIERLHRDHLAQLKKLRKAPGNVGCADCGASDNSWASVNLGCFLCVDCASVHRGLGTHITKCKNTSGTYLWGPDEISVMETKGNARVNAEYLASRTAPPMSACVEDRRAFLPRKYVKREWAAAALPDEAQRCAGETQVPTELRQQTRPASFEFLPADGADRDRARPAQLDRSLTGRPNASAARPGMVPMVPARPLTPPRAAAPVPPPAGPAPAFPMLPVPAPAFPTLPVPARNEFRARRLTPEEAAQLPPDLFAFAQSPQCRSEERSPLISLSDRSPLIGFGNAGDDWLEGW